MALLLCGTALAADKPINLALPSIFIAGDSTSTQGIPVAIGWGRPFPIFFDLQKVNIVNDARGGRNSRTFITEGLWDHLLERLKPNDYVLIQFGDNDGGPTNDAKRARGSLSWIGRKDP